MIERERSGERAATAGFATLLAALSMIGPFAVDTYLPSFPAIQSGLNVSAVEVQQTLSVYLLAFAVMTPSLFGSRRSPQIIGGSGAACRSS